MALYDTLLDARAWRSAAACRDADTAIFFPATDADAGPARAVCAGCPVQQACLDFALSTRQNHGVWGGLTETERRRLRRKRQEAARTAARAA